MPNAAPQSSSLVARSGTMPLLAHEAYAADVVQAYFSATSPEAFAGLPQAFDRMRGDRADDAPWNSYKVESGVALIPVMGSLIPRGTFVGCLYGVTSYEGLQSELRRATKDPAVEQIALMIDSPGGYVSGLDAVANAVKTATESKPVTAYVQGMACSAAYWIASQADEIVCSPQSELGSIGVLQVHFDMSKMLDEIGIKVTLLHAGAKKVDGNPFEPLSDRVKAEMNQRLEDLRMAFAEAVAGGRSSLDVAAVLATEAGTFIGEDAVKRGLADRVGFLADDLPDPDELFVTSPTGRFMETVMNYTQAQLDAAVATAKEAAHADGKKVGIDEGRTEGHKAGLEAGKAEGHAAGKAEGETAGAAAERERIKSIRGCDEAKKRPSTAEQIALTTDMSAEAAKAFLANLPEEKAGKGADTLDTEMDRDRQPLVGADGKPLQTSQSDEEKAYAEGRAAGLRHKGKKAD